MLQFQTLIFKWYTQHYFYQNFRVTFYSRQRSPVWLGSAWGLRLSESLPRVLHLRRYGNSLAPSSWPLSQRQLSGYFICSFLPTFYSIYKFRPFLHANKKNQIMECCSKEAMLLPKNIRICPMDIFFSITKQLSSKISCNYNFGVIHHDKLTLSGKFRWSIMTHLSTAPTLRSSSLWL